MPGMSGIDLQNALQTRLRRPDDLHNRVSEERLRRQAVASEPSAS